MTCASCGHVNAEGQKFCGECGSPLQAVCGSCGNSNPPGHEAAPLVAEARETFERLRATPWLERNDEPAARLPQMDRVPA